MIAGTEYETFQKLELVLSWATLHFVGWVEPTAGFVGFLRLRRTNLHFTGVIAKCETQQRPISELSPKSLIPATRQHRQRENARLSKNETEKIKAIYQFPSKNSKGCSKNNCFRRAGPKQLLPVALLALLCLIVYYNSLSNGFVYDDLGSIVENKYIKQPGRFIASLFSQSYYQFAGLEASYRPVATLSYFLIYAIAELNPFYYHLASLILHTLNAILVYWLANLILQNRLRALIAGMLFACHPVLSEAVNCIDFNDDLLAAFFFMLALIFYIRIKAEGCNRISRAYSLALVFYLLGLLSKEMAITLPAVILSSRRCAAG